MNEIKIFLTNLGKYNEGELIGEWVELPVYDDFEEVLERIGIDDNYEEWFISDYEAPFEIGEYDNIYSLNDIACDVDGMTDFEVEAIGVLVDDGGYDIYEAVRMVRGGDVFYYPECDCEEDIAYRYLEETGVLDELPDWACNYFDFEKYGREIVSNGDFYWTNSGAVEVAR